MNAPNEATRQQLRAATPYRSTWLAANAGSGKTRVLTDRVARLLLNGVRPQHILCLTYTKAAASEMQNRLFKRLGAWAMLDDDALSDDLSELGVDTSEIDLDAARTLFACAIETPGGLKIQTIHSFCAALLRQFPLEAGISPQFKEMEDRAADLLRAEIVDDMAGGEAQHLVTGLARFVSGSDFRDLTKTIVANAAQFDTVMDLEDTLDHLGHPRDLSYDGILQEAFWPDDRADLDALIDVLGQGGKQDNDARDTLSSVKNLDLTALAVLETVFLTGKGAKRPFGAKIGTFPTKALREAHPALMERINPMMERVETARDARAALETAERTAALHAFAEVFLKRFASAKAQRGWLDFDDLIEKARQLLNDPQVAAWVLYRLDGGIDHILVDEAQDTSPAQWDVIRKLAEEFGAGDGARQNTQRTIFVVGDKKQSIYSFQGADPREFDRMQQEFASRLHDVGQDLQDLTLRHSFRSAPAILEFVDAVFETHGQQGFGRSSEHIAFKEDLPGRVDLWPRVEKGEELGKPVWYDPVDRVHPTHPNNILAEQVAAEIRRMLDTGVQIPDGNGGARPVQARDFLILVQKRSGVFPQLIRALKAADLPIAGADRLKVGAELAVKDIAALLSFLATSDDSLSLAIALRSPLFGWTEQQIFDLAHHRTRDQLWVALQERKAEFAESVAVLEDLRRQIDYLRPYELIERVLTRHDGRKKLIARLGHEAEDGIDALLSQALSFESTAVPSLTGFLAWLETDELEIKRQIDTNLDQIRIMTAHGAKGLEAPIVILPDCGPARARISDPFVNSSGRAIWQQSTATPRAIRDVVAEHKDADAAERLRLLYVALTRAKKWLIIAATGSPSDKKPDWYHIAQKAMQNLDAQPLPMMGGESGLRLEAGAWKSPSQRHQPVGEQDVEAPLDQCFAEHVSQQAEPQRFVTPSALPGAKALPGEGIEMERAKIYGTFVHHLLEILPQHPSADWGRHLESAEANLPPEMIAAGRAEALAVLRKPELGHLFGPRAQAEVGLSATVENLRVHGIVDRLIVADDIVTAVDFKTNRQVPGDVQDIPEGLLNQMGAYTAALAQIFPEKRIETAILWTRTADLMHIPHDMVINFTLGRLNLDGVEGAT